MIKFIKRLFRRELGNILKVFDKAEKQLAVYIDRTEAEALAAQAALNFHQNNLGTARVIRNNLVKLTSGE